MKRLDSRVARWGGLALLALALGGCCVAPWGMRGHGRHHGALEPAQAAAVVATAPVTAHIGS